MENKNENITYKTREERKKIEENLKNVQIKKEKELEEKRKELKNIIFDENKKNIYKKQKIENKDITKPKAANIMLSITFVIALFITVYLIIDSSTKIDQIYQIINAFLLLIIVTCFLISFKKSFFKNKSAPTIITSIMVLGALTFNGLYMTNTISLPKQSYLPNFESVNLTKAINWTQENNVKTNQEFEYSDVTEKYSVISQSKKPETLTKDIKKVDFVVSNGPDYNKEIILADMTGWNVDDVLKFVNENFLNNVTINFVENLNIKKDTIISQSKTGQIKRSEPIIFTVSLGNKADLSPIKLKDLKNENLLNASVYLGRNGILYEIKYEFSNEIEKGHVISTTPKPNTTVKPDELITITISKGKEIKMPNLKNKTMAYVTKWMVENNLQINYSDRSDNNIKSGRVIESNYKEGDIIEEGTTVDIIFSKGPLIMKKFNTINEFKSWADTNGIKYEIKEEFSNEIAKDQIIKTSIEEGKNINLTDIITVYVSKGEAVTIPDFKNKTKSEVQTECNNLGIKCNFTEEYSASVSTGKVIKQNISAGTQISKGDTIIITIATNKKINNSNKTSNSSASSNSSNNSSSNNSNSSGGSSSNKPTTNQCKSSSYNINLRDLNNIFNSYSGFTEVKKQLETHFQNNYPGLNVIIKDDSTSDASSGSYVGGFKGGTVSCPSTIEIIIAK